MRIRATVDAHILNHSEKLFNGKAATRATELIQNARRAGASLIKITQGRMKVPVSPRGDAVHEISVEDDGSGIQDWGQLLNLGGSGWGADMDAAEEPAGIGLFSLAPRDVIIQSQGCMARINAKAWRGLEDVKIEQDTSTDRPRRGTRVTFDDANWGPSDEGYYNNVGPVVRAAGIFGPCDIEFGEEIIKHDPFLIECSDPIIHLPEIGCRFQLRNYNDLAGGTPARAHTLNFHGLMVGCADLVDYDVTRAVAPQVILRVDMDAGPSALRFQLPGRDALFQNKACRALKAAVRDELYRHIARRPRHSLSYVKYVEALEVVPDMQEADPQFSYGGLITDRGNDSGPDAPDIPYGFTLSESGASLSDELVVTLDGEEDADVDHVNLLRSLMEFDDRIGFVTIPPRYHGYAWAKLDRKVVSVEVTTGEVLAEDSFQNSTISVVDHLQCRVGIKSISGENELVVEPGFIPCSFDDIFIHKDGLEGKVGQWAFFLSGGHSGDDSREEADREFEEMWSCLKDSLVHNMEADRRRCVEAVDPRCGCATIVRGTKDVIFIEADNTAVMATRGGDLIPVNVKLRITAEDGSEV